MTESGCQSARFSGLEASVAEYVVRRWHHQYFHDPSPYVLHSAESDWIGQHSAIRPEVWEANNWTMVSDDTLVSSRDGAIARLRFAAKHALLFHGTQYQGIAHTIVQLIRRSNSGVIAPSQQIRSEQ